MNFSTLWLGLVRVHSGLAKMPSKNAQILWLRDMTFFMSITNMAAKFAAYKTE